MIAPAARMAVLVDLVMVVAAVGRSGPERALGAAEEAARHGPSPSETDSSTAPLGS